MHDQGQVRSKVMRYILPKAVLLSSICTKLAYHARVVKSDSQVKFECLKTGLVYVNALIHQLLSLFTVIKAKQERVAENGGNAQEAMQSKL